LLSGSIPPEIGAMSALLGLHLDFNRLTGSLPSELGNLSSLQYLMLDHNQLHGSLPPELGSLSSLQRLSLHYNKFTGSIPLSFINLNQLNVFSFGETQLCEPMSPEYEAWKATISSYSGTGICKIPCSEITEIPQNECEALVALYERASGAFWTNNIK